MKIMVVDDERDIESLFIQKFRKEIRKGELEIEFAFSGEEALKKIKNDSSSIVLILSDINMPGMNGLELLKILKKELPEQKVYIVSAYEDHGNYEKALEYGADEFINKPVDFEYLRKRIFTE